MSSAEAAGPQVVRLDPDHPLDSDDCATLFAGGARRLEVILARSDLRRLDWHLLGFRREGVLRRRGPDGADQVLYALLADDPMQGRERWSGVMNSVTARKRAIGHLLFSDDEGRVCLLETSFKPDWELPGGILEPGEPPRTAITRECLEELSYRPRIGRLLVVDWLAPYLGWEDAIELVYDGGVLSEQEKLSLQPDGREILSVHWLLPDQAAAAMASFAAGRLTSAVRAAAEGITIDLEAGNLADQG